MPDRLTREAAEELDQASPLRDRRDLFTLPERGDIVAYLTGNSLGAMPEAVPARLSRVLAEEWGRGMVASWNTAGWLSLAGRVGDRIAPLIGAAPGTVGVGDSTSVALFKAMAAALNLRPDRDVIVIEPTTFPTDGYVAQGVAKAFGKQVRWCDPADPAASLSDDVALLTLAHVDFRTGALFDLAGLTAAAHEAGAVMLWDLSHSVGAVPLDLSAADADLAVGCTYKYLNGGPGSPAFGYVAPSLLDVIEQPITGWWGHANPFEMRQEFEPAKGIARMAVGTPPVLALAALDTALDAFDGVTPAELRGASLSLTDLFIDLVDARVPGVLELLTPREHARRGSQVSWRHPAAYGLVQALAARGVLGDFREPEVARFGFAPLYLRHVDVYDAVTQMAEVVAGQEHLDPAYAAKAPVT